MSDLVTAPAPEVAPEKLTAWQRWEAPNFDCGALSIAQAAWHFPQPRRSKEYSVRHAMKVSRPAMPKACRKHCRKTSALPN